MKTPNFRRNRVAAAVAGAVLALGATQSLATGFQLNEQSASSIGNAFAAGAAFTDDVSAMWWNPAAMSSFNTRQFAAAVHLVTPMLEFNNSASLPAFNQPLGNNGGDAGGLNFVPNMFFSMPINPQWSIGVAINGPFGSKTEYDDGWIGRYQALLSEILTVNVNPAISWRPVPNFAVGVGVNYQYLDGTFTQNYNYSAAMAAAAGAAAAAGQIPAATVPQVVAATPGLDGKATIKGDDSAWGWNIGAAWDVNPQWRLAASYRSELKYNLRGSSDYNNPAVPLPPNAQLAAIIATLSNAVNNSATFRGQSVSSDITLPAIANISTVFRLKDALFAAQDGTAADPSRD
jgi:long-chain fatty acid transport protein